MNRQKKRCPRIGQRMLRTALAVILIFGIYYGFGVERTPFYAAIAAILCTQPYIGNTKKMGWNRTAGTLIGAFYGSIVTILEVYIFKIEFGSFPQLLLVAVMIIPILYTTVVLKKTSAAFISCVVFLSTTVVNRGTESPIVFVLFRVVDTLLGIFISYVVMQLHLPRGKRDDILFVSALDDTLVKVDQQMTAYSRIDLNHMLEKGLMFTIYTERTPASLLTVLEELHLKLPVIAMGGAVLYDIQENRYVMEYIIPAHAANQIQHILEQEGRHYFQNVIVEDVLLIYYEPFQDPVQEQFYEKLRKSPYRNYMRQSRPMDQGVVYFSLLDTRERIRQLREILEEKCTDYRIRIQIHEDYYKGYDFMRIFSKNATRENMLHYLKKMTHANRLVTFGSIEGEYDEVVQDENMNQVVKTIKNTFEPVQIHLSP